jgi:hypothetical protein
MKQYTEPLLTNGGKLTDAIHRGAKSADDFRVLAKAASGARAAFILFRKHLEDLPLCGYKYQLEKTKTKTPKHWKKKRVF